jgi:Flp pilus assembly pilin Flp
MLLDLFVRAKAFAWGVREKLHREDGAVATEYGLLLVFIALAIIAAVVALGIILSNIFTNASTSLGTAS